jgi:hypothetical protein
MIVLIVSGLVKLLGQEVNMRNKLGQFIKGCKISDEIKNKMKGRVAWNKGISVDCGGRKFKKGDKAHLGCKHTEESKKKISEKLKGRVAWNKGLGNKTSSNDRARDSIEFYLWREAVFTRDNWTCQKCLVKGFKLHPHHIKNFCEEIELRFAIDNGITLCEKHHREFHKKYGQRKNNQEQIYEYIR